LWDQQLSAQLGLAKQAARYRRKYGLKPTLIVDGFDLLAETEEGRQAFIDLMDFAKIQADEGDLTVVFLSSEGLGTQMATSAFGVDSVLRSVWCFDF
jgi:hypothetical protein